MHAVGLCAYVPTICKGAKDPCHSLWVQIPPRKLHSNEKGSQIQFASSHGAKCCFGSTLDASLHRLPGGALHKVCHCWHFGWGAFLGLKAPTAPICLSSKLIGHLLILAPPPATPPKHHSKGTEAEDLCQMLCWNARDAVAWHRCSQGHTHLILHLDRECNKWKACSNPCT